MLLIFSLEISFVLNLFFSKLAKYLHVQLCLLLSEVSILVFFSYFFECIIFFLFTFFNVSILSWSDVSKTFFCCYFKISFSVVSSCCLVCFFVWVANSIVSFRITPFIISQRVFGFGSLLLIEFLLYPCIRYQVTSCYLI